MVTPPDIEQQILRYYHAEKWTVGTIARQLHVHPNTVTYRLDREGVRVRTALRTRRFAWSSFTQARTSELGVVLRSPVRRSVHLLAPGRRAEVERLVAAFLSRKT